MFAWRSRTDAIADWTKQHAPCAACGCDVVPQPHRMSCLRLFPAGVCVYAVSWPQFSILVPGRFFSDGLRGFRKNIRWEAHTAKTNPVQAYEECTA